MTDFDEKYITGEARFVESVYESIKTSINTTKSLQRNVSNRSGGRGLYHTVYKQYLGWLKKEKIIEQDDNDDFDRCPGFDHDLNVPWVDRDIVQSFITSIERDSATTGEQMLRKLVTALNKCIEFQNNLIGAVYGNPNNVVPLQNTISTKDLQVAVARKNARFKKKGVYKKTSSATNPRATLVQTDPQGTHLTVPVNEKDMKKVVWYWLYSYKAISPFMKSVYRMMYIWGTFALMRGDELRNKFSTWGHFGIFEGSRIFGPDRPHVFYFLKDQSKTSVGNSHLTALLRHLDVTLCGVNAVGQLLIMRAGKASSHNNWFKNVLNGEINWHENASVVCMDNGKAMPYSRQFLNKKQDKGGDDGNDFHYEEFTKMYKDLGITSHKVTHLRLQGNAYASDRGANMEDLGLLGRWIQKQEHQVLQVHYMSNLTMKAMLPMAGVHSPFVTSKSAETVSIV